MADRRVTQSGEDPQADLLATLAASRELGPEMDKALAESYLAKHGQPAGTPSRRQEVGAPAQVTPVTQAIGMIGPVIGFGVWVGLLIASGGHLWWLFWLPMALGGWWWGMWNPDARRHHHRERREEWRRARYEAREQYRAERRGYPYPSAPRPAEYLDRPDMSADSQSHVEATPRTHSPHQQQQPPASTPTSPMPPANPAG